MNIQRVHKNKKQGTVGRGGKRGKTSGRGTKGQRARAGRKIRPAIRDQIKKLPRLRGVTINKRGSLHSAEHTDAFVVYLEKLNVLTAGETVTPKLLVEKKIAKLVSGRVPKIKILDKGEIKVKLTISGCGISAGARKKIESVGGNIA